MTLQWGKSYQKCKYYNLSQGRFGTLLKIKKKKNINIAIHLRTKIDYYAYTQGDSYILYDLSLNILLTNRFLKNIYLFGCIKS